MMYASYLPEVVVEFPENEYILTVNKSSGSDYEYVTLSSSYKQGSSYYFRWFRNMQSSCSPENVYEKISAMMDVFEWHNAELCVSLREYVLNEGIIQTCFRLKLEDSDLVCEVLDLLYACWCSFGPLHLGAILGRQRQNREKEKRSPCFISFFLEHARRRKLEYDGIRMIDISMYSAVRKSAVMTAAKIWNWKHMLVYLQHGAEFETLLQDPTGSQYGVSSALTEILRSLIMHLWFRLVKPSFYLKSIDHDAIAEYLSNLPNDVKKLCRTFNILLRALRRIQFGSLDYMIRDNDYKNTVKMIPTRDVMKHCTVTTVIPKLFKRYECPEELKHGCRWMIRKRLNENWQLPSGIRDLPVPESLKRYLNLLAD